VPFDHVLGQQPAVETLTRALVGGHVHHAYRFEGMAGVGKELAAVALAQALLCPSDEVLGCGVCDTCRRAAATTAEEPRLPLHPDLVLIERGLYPPESLGRREPESNEISVAQIRRVVLGRLAYPPHEGHARIFLVRRAEELSPSAANALLKALEEPKPRTYFVLLCAQPDRLLPTIRSRSLGVRFGPLPDEIVARILLAHGVAEPQVAAAVALGGGSAATALEAADPERSAARQGFVDGVLAAVTAPELDVAVQLGEGYSGDRRRLLGDLAALSAHYARDARSVLASSPGSAERAARCYAWCGRAAEAVERNASRQLSLIQLVLSLRRP
jgi:DNA polymerase-3 subunit delta'